jgi:hypothetical protein
MLPLWDRPSLEFIANQGFKMFNLLPPERKKVILREYYLRLSALVLSMVSVTGIVTLVLLVPSFSAVKIKESRNQEELKNIRRENPELNNKENLEALALEINRKLEILEPREVLLPTHVIQRIINSQPEGIFLASISYMISGESIDIKITGQGSTREALTAFAGNLREDKTFKSVNLPTSDLAKDRDINFSIVLIVDS